MKDKLMNSISAVINALNMISVSGKDNLANLSGSIAVLEQVLGDLSAIEFRENTTDGEAAE